MSQSGWLLRRRGRRLPASAGRCATHRDSIISRFERREDAASLRAAGCGELLAECACSRHTHACNLRSVPHAAAAACSYGYGQMVLTEDMMSSDLQQGTSQPDMFGGGGKLGELMAAARCTVNIDGGSFTSYREWRAQTRATSCFVISRSRLSFPTQAKCPSFARRNRWRRSTRSTF